MTQLELNHIGEPMTINKISDKPDLEAIIDHFGLSGVLGTIFENAAKKRHILKTTGRILL